MNDQTNEWMKKLMDEEKLNWISGEIELINHPVINQSIKQALKKSIMYYNYFNDCPEIQTSPL